MGDQWQIQGWSKLPKSNLHCVFFQFFKAWYVTREPQIFSGSAPPLERFLICSSTGIERASSKRSPPWSTRRCLGLLPATWLMTVALSPTLLQDCAQQRLECFSSVTRRLTLAQSFSAAGPRVWIYLPTDLTQPDLSYSHFRQFLKTFLFGQRDKL